MAANSSTSNANNLLYHCFSFDAVIYSTTAFITTRTLLSLPLCALILHLGHRRWRRQRSTNTMSHSDIFTYHVAAMEMSWVLVFLCFFCGHYADLPDMKAVGLCTVSFVSYGENYFHILTCVDRYLAVVHPVVYLGLKNGLGARIRNISIGCAWLLCLGSTGTTALYFPDFPTIPFILLLVSSLIVMSFCSFSVLCVLIRPGPGEGGEQKQHVDQSKQRAFYTITAIFVALWLWFAGFIAALAVHSSSLLSPSVTCVVVGSSSWFSLPISLVLPLLYLHRVRKHSCC